MVERRDHVGLTQEEQQNTHLARYRNPAGAAARTFLKYTLLLPLTVYNKLNSIGEALVEVPEVRREAGTPFVSETVDTQQQRLAIEPAVPGASYSPLMTAFMREGWVAPDGDSPPVDSHTLVLAGASRSQHAIAPEAALPEGALSLGRLGEIAKNAARTVIHKGRGEVQVPVMTPVFDAHQPSGSQAERGRNTHSGPRRVLSGMRRPSSPRPVGV